MIRRLDVPHHGVRARREEVRAACSTGNARRRHGRHDVTAVRPRADKRTGRTLKRVRPVFFVPVPVPRCPDAPMPGCPGLPSDLPCGSCPYPGATGFVSGICAGVRVAVRRIGGRPIFCPAGTGGRDKCVSLPPLISVRRAPLRAVQKKAGCRETAPGFPLCSPPVTGLRRRASAARSCRCAGPAGSSPCCRRPSAACRG